MKTKTKTNVAIAVTLLLGDVGLAYSNVNQEPSKLTIADKNEQAVSNLALPASSLIGEKVVNYKGEDLGKVKEIMLNTNTGKVVYVVISFGGFLGVGDKLFAVPMSALKFDTANAQFKLNKSKEDLENASGFDKNNWPATSSDYWSE